MLQLQQPRNRTGSITDRSNLSGKDFQATTSNADIQAKPLRSSALQSMLKNNIETGDLGQFSVKPSQLPLPTKRAVPLSTGPVYHPSSRRILAREYTENEVDFRHSPHYPYPESTGSSSVVSSRQNKSKKSDQPSPQVSASQTERSYSMSQSSVINHGVASSQLLTTTRIQQPGNMRALRPRSPFAYPTRLKRPGYRPSSPALSELHKDIQLTKASGHPVAESRAESPAYSYISRRAPSVWQEDSNFSDPSFRNQQPSPTIRFNQACSSSPLPPRKPTPGPLLSLDQNSSLSSRESLGDISAKDGWNIQNSLSPLPVFYDYTEAFENDHFPKCALLEADEVILKNVENDFVQIKRSSSMASLKQTLALGESPNSPLVGNSDTSGAGNPSSSVSQRPSILTARRDIAQSYPGPVHQAFSVDEGVATPTSQHQLQRKAKSVLVNNVNSKEIHGASVAASSRREIQQHESGGLDIAMSKSNASFASIPCFRSSSESLYSMQSSSHHEPPILGLQPKSLSEAEIDSRKQGEEIPFYSGQPSFAPELEDPVSLRPALRAASFDYWSDSEPSQIYAPTPERSLSSPSHRDRFSRIFSIGEGLTYMDEVAVDKNQSSRYQIPERHLKASRIEHSEDAKGSLSQTETSLISSPKVALAMRQSGVDQDSQEDACFTHASKEEPSKSTTMNQDEQPAPSNVSLERITVRSNPLQPLASLRIKKPRRPALSLPIFPPQLETVDVEMVNNIARNIVPGQVGLNEEKGVVPQIMRHFPSLPSIPSIMSCSPPIQPTSSTLPLSFKPLLISEMDNVMFEHMDGNQSPQTGHKKVENEGCSVKHKSQARYKGQSTDSLPGSRPWNIDASYPWTDKPPQLEVTMPDGQEDLPTCTTKAPRFRLKLHRASSGVAGPTKMTKLPYFLDLSANPKGNISSNFSRPEEYSRALRPSITINQNNSSHVSQMATRYLGNANSPLGTGSVISPSVNRVPPSSGPNLELRSFFSDDSSQIPPKGSLRKRISQLKAIAAKTNSAEENRGTDRGFLASTLQKSRASGRSSRQEATPTERMHNLRRTRWRIADKLRGWFQFGGRKVRSWRGKMASKSFKARSSNAEWI